VSDYYEHPASASNSLLEGRDVLLAWLKDNPGEHHMVDVCQTLGWRGNKVGLIANKYPRYFRSWEEYVRPNRKSFITLHPHLRQ